MIIYIFIACRITSNSLYSAFQKRLTLCRAHPTFIIITSYLAFTIITLPLLFFIKISNFTFTCWRDLFLMASLDAAGNILAIMSLNLTELSIFSSINAFKPIVAMLIGVIMLNEIPDIWGIIGTIIILSGSYVLGLSQEKSWHGLGMLKLLLSKSFFYRVSAMLLFVFSNVYAKKAMLLTSPLAAIAFWAILGLPILMLGAIRLKSHEIKENITIFKSHTYEYVLTLFCMIIMQVFTMFMFSKTYVAYALALFQLSAVVNVFIGYKYFKEKQIFFKFCGSLIMILGLVLICMGKTV